MSGPSGKNVHMQPQTSKVARVGLVWAGTSLLAGILANIVAGVMFSLTSIATSVAVHGQLPDIGAYLGVIAAFIALTLIGAAMALYITRRPPQVQAMKERLVASYLRALDASELNPRRQARVQHG